MQECEVRGKELMKERKRVIKRQIHRHTEGQTYTEREREREGG